MDKMQIRCVRITCYETFASVSLSESNEGYPQKRFGGFARASVFSPGEEVIAGSCVRHFHVKEVHNYLRLLEMAGSSIVEFYENTNIFITGGTGFLGKCTIEKLLRVTTNSKLFILIRQKKDKSVERRKEEFFDDVVFHKIKEYCPRYDQRIVFIQGDVSLPHLGISDLDRQILRQTIDIVFHSAATVRFNENLKRAYDINVKGTSSMIQLAKEMRHLKCFVHISTAYSNCYLSDVEEKFYDTFVDYEEVGKLLARLTPSEVEKRTESIIKPWPNTYTYTKALAESLIKKNADGIPLGLFRPSIMSSSYKEPFSNFIDNFSGPMSICALSNLGLVRVMWCDDSKRADFVPIDMCVSALLAVAWDAKEKLKLIRDVEDIPIYNYAASEHALTWGEYFLLNKRTVGLYPPTTQYWMFTLLFVSNYYLFSALQFLFHILPALLVDFFGLLFFKKIGLYSKYEKIHETTYMIGYFSTREWNFHCENILKLWKKMGTEDRKKFDFNMEHIDWWSYTKNYLWGMRKYALKDSDSSIEEAKKKFKRLKFLHKVLVTSVYATLIVFTWTILKRAFGL